MKMETSDYDFHYETYRRVPMNSATTQKDITDFNSIGTYSTYSTSSRSNKPIMTTTYIDGTTMLGQYDRSYNMNDLFPKGRGRQKPIDSSEKKNAHDAYMSLLPTDTSTNRSEKIRSRLSMAKPTQTKSNLPEVSSKNVNIRNKRVLHTTTSNDNSESKFYTRSVSTPASGAWIRRYKSITESQILSDLLRNQSYGDKILLIKRPYQQVHLSSSSSITPSLNKRRREKC